MASRNFQDLVQAKEQIRQMGIDAIDDWRQRRAQKLLDELTRFDGFSKPASDLLDEVSQFLRRYVVLSPEQADAISLWAAHTHAIEAAGTTPYLQISSAEKRSGKTTLLDLLALLVARPWAGVAASEAAIYRMIDRNRPTLVIDEYDTIFDPRRAARPEFQAILNAGYQRGKTVPRWEGKELGEFDLFGPKALAGIGELPETIADRSIRIRLKRRKQSEELEKFRPGRPPTRAVVLQQQLASRMGAHLLELRQADPTMPEGLDDRAEDIWEALIAIADLAGASWPERGRSAAMLLSAGRQTVDGSEGVRLLADIRRVFDDRGVDRKDGLTNTCFDRTRVFGGSRPLCQGNCASAVPLASGAKSSNSSGGR